MLEEDFHYLSVKSLRSNKVKRIGSVSTFYFQTFWIPEALAQIIPRLPKFRKCRHILFRDFRTPGYIGNIIYDTFRLRKVSAQIIPGLPEFRKCRHILFRDFRTVGCVGTNCFRTSERKEPGKFILF